MKYDLVIKNGLVFMEGIFSVCDIAVKCGKIAGILEIGSSCEADRVIDATGQYVIPGSIDTHVHFRDPCLTEYEDFYTGSMAAAAGGVTTVMEHPISRPPVYSKEIFEKRVEIAKPQSVVDFTFLGAAGSQYPEKIAEVAKCPIPAFKVFLHDAPAGREQDFINLTMKNDADILRGFKEVAKTGKYLMVHAENNDIIAYNINKFRKEGKVTPLDHCLSRPEFAEYECVEKILAVAKLTGVRVGFAHISTVEAMELIKKAKAEGQDVLLETCPHYLLTDESYVKKYKGFAKCNPPLRKKETMEGLWKYIEDGTVDFIGSDHSGFSYESKIKGEENIFDVTSGFPGIDLRVPLMLDAVSEGKISLKRAIELLCVNPAKIFGFYPRKGIIRVGADADMVIFNLDEHTVFHKENSYSKSKDIYLMYDNKDMKCRLKYTICRGRVVMENGKVDESAKGYGEYVEPDSEENL